MHKFKVGDRVMLSPNSRWVNDYSNRPDSNNPLNVVGVITYMTSYGRYRIYWGNGTCNSSYTDHCLLPAGNYITVDSLDYDRNEDLSDEDKSIIRSYVESQAV